MRGRGASRAWILAAAVPYLFPARATAIPVFARIYDKPCAACHTVFPQLNAAGEDFRAHGLHGLRPAVAPLKAGKEFELPGTLPVAITLGAGEDVSRTEVSGTPSSIEHHFNLDYLALLAGGELGPHAAFLADYAPVVTNPTTGDIRSNTRLGLGFLQLHGERWGWLANAKLGLFELPLGVSPRVHRLSVQPYLVYDLTGFDVLGQRPPVHGARKDSVLLDATQIGAELDGLHPATGVGWACGFVAGENNRSDNNASQDVFGRLSRDFGPHRAGLFLYWSPDTLAKGARDEVLRVGPDLTLSYRRVRVMGQMLAAHDSNPTGRHVGLWTYGGFVESDIRIATWLLSLVRFEYLSGPRFSDESVGGDVNLRPEVWAVVAGLQYLLAENLKIVTEGSYGVRHALEGTYVETDSQGTGHPSATTWTLTLRLVTAFWPLTPPRIAPRPEHD